MTTDGRPDLMPPRESFPPLAWSVVVPVKRAATAKSRLRAAVPADAHHALVVAMALDTVAAAMAARGVAQLVVVTDDAATAEAAESLGATVVGDLPEAGLNAALAYGAQQAVAAQPRCGVAALAADLPALRPDDLTLALSRAAAHRRALVPDWSGSGTTLLTARSGLVLHPAYGGSSRDRHVAAGVVDLLAGGVGAAADLATLRRDVDTPADLVAARVLGLGTHSAALLRALAS